MNQERERKLQRLRQNSLTMLKRFLVVTPGHNAGILKKPRLENLDN